MRVELEDIAIVPVPLTRIKALLNFLLEEDYKGKLRTEPEVAYFIRVVEGTEANIRGRVADITRGL